MKKTVSLILALVLCLSMCACSTADKEGQYTGTYQHEYESSEYYSGWGYNNLVNDIKCRRTLTLASGGAGAFNVIITEGGTYYKMGDIIQEGTVTWVAEGNYITVTYSGTKYIKDYGKNTEESISHTETYEIKAGTLHDASSGSLVYAKIR